MTDPDSLPNGVWYEHQTESGTVTVIQHVDPSVDANDFPEDPEMPVYSGPVDQADAFADAIKRGVEEVEA